MLSICVVGGSDYCVEINTHYKLANKGVLALVLATADEAWCLNQTFSDSSENQLDWHAFQSMLRRAVVICICIPYFLALLY